MRTTVKTSRIRILIVSACLLFSGAALATGSPALSAHAAAMRPAAYTLKVHNPGNQVTYPLPATVSLQIKVTDTDPVKTALTYTAKGLPPGLSIALDTGLISGTITVKHTGEVTVSVEDWTTLETAKTTFIWTAGMRLGRLTVIAPATEHTWAGIPVSVKIGVKDAGRGDVTYSATGLPAGLKINAATGVITGTAAKVSLDTVRVTAIDSSGLAGTAAIRWSVGWAVTMPDPGRVITTAGQALNVPLTYTDALGTRDHVTFRATGLPAGLFFVQHPARVYGWAATAGSYTVTVYAKGSLGDSDFMTFPLTVLPAADSGPTGQIRLTLGKCLDDPGDSAADGTRVVLWTCRSGSAQRWTIAADGTIRMHGRCLDIGGAGDPAGQQVRLEPCTGAARESWVQGTAGELVSPASGLCLTDPGSSTANGAAPAMGACRLTRNATWTLPAQPVLDAMTGKCLDDYHSVGTNGNKVDTYSCNGTAVQSWTFEPDGTLRIYGNKCLTVSVYGAVGARIDLWTCEGAASQRWTVVRAGGLSSELTQGGVCLAIPSMTAIDGTQLITAPCTATDPRVHWHVW